MTGEHDAVTRFEVIDHTSDMRGRVLVRHGCKITINLTDHGRTMKVFLTDADLPPDAAA